MFINSVGEHDDLILTDGEVKEQDKGGDESLFFGLGLQFYDRPPQRGQFQVGLQTVGLPL